MNKNKIKNWIDWMYRETNKDHANNEIYKFLTRAEYMGLIDCQLTTELKEYNEYRVKLGEYVDDYEKYLNSEVKE